MNKQGVASHAAADLYASEGEQVIPEYEELSEADQERVNWAIEEVRGRLYRMGKQGTRDD
jgi:hypothetical protein